MNASEALQEMASSMLQMKLDFTEEMKVLHKKYKNDPEAFHVQADSLMCEILQRFGYNDLVDIFTKTAEWYT